MRLENEIFVVGNRKQRKSVNTTYVIVSYTVYGYITFFLNCLKVNINHNFEWCKLCGTLIECKYVVQMHIYIDNADPWYLQITNNVDLVFFPNTANYKWVKVLSLYWKKMNWRVSWHLKIMVEIQVEE